MFAPADAVSTHTGGQRRDLLRMVLAGCGAVTRQYYASALARLQRDGVAKIIGIFDPDPDALRVAQGQLPPVAAAAAFHDLLRLGADIAIIASPPCFHANQCVEALHAGLHVFCEKPLATTTMDAERIIAAADAKGLSVGTGLVRRYFPATRAIKSVLESGMIGPLQSVSCFEGGPFDWPVASTEYFTRIQSGGGVLQDIGTHCLDLLIWWLGTPADVEYSDDAMGGVEANCLVRLCYDNYEANIRLSRDWARPNRYRLEGERGWISWAVEDIEAIEVGFNGSGTKGTLTLTDSPRQRDFLGCFTAQISSFVSAVRAGASPPVPAEAGRDVLALIERCYAVRRLIDMPWLSCEERSRGVELGEARP